MNYRGNYGRLIDSIFAEEPPKIPHDTLMLWGDQDRAKKLDPSTTSYLAQF